MPSSYGELSGCMVSLHIFSELYVRFHTFWCQLCVHPDYSQPQGSCLVICTVCACSIQFSSIQDGVHALRKACMFSLLSLRCFWKVAFETVSIFVWLVIALSHPFIENCQSLGRLSTASSFCTSLLQSVFCCCCCFLVSQASQHLASAETTKPLAVVALPTSLSSKSFSSTPTCPGQCMCCHALQCSVAWRSRTQWRWSVSDVSQRQCVKSWKTGQGLIHTVQFALNEASFFTMGSQGTVSNNNNGYLKCLTGRP